VQFRERDNHEKEKTIGMVIEKHNLIAVSYKEQLSKKKGEEKSKHGVDSEILGHASGEKKLQ